MNIDINPAALDKTAWPRTAAARNGEVEVLRTVAILMVLVQHLPFNLIFWPSKFSEPIFLSGTWCGVDLFFAVSGFVIARNLLPQLEGIRDVRKFMHITVTFWIRRAWRLWPSAWFWLAAALVLCQTFNHSGAYGSLLVNWKMDVAAFSNLANFYIAFHFADPGGHGAAFPQWSLSLEEQFYLILPFAALLFRRYLAVFLGLLLVLAFFEPFALLTNNTRSGAFAVGVLLAMASNHPAYADCAPVFLARSRLARIAIMASGVTLLVCLGNTGWRIVPFILGVIALPSGLLVWVASYDAGYLWRPGWPRRLAEIVAARSYSIYLIHIPVYFGMHEAWYRIYKLAEPTHLQAVAFFAITLCILASVTELNHRLLERPLREHGKQVARRYALHMQERVA